VRVWAPPEQISQGKFALDVGVKVLQYYEEIFQVDYPLPKQGMESTLFLQLILQLLNIFQLM